MKNFLDWNWIKVGKAMSPAAKLIRLSPTSAQIYLHPYGHIEVANNGGEVNVSWSYIQRLELPLPECIQVESFSYKGSIAYGLPGDNETKIGLRIKETLDEAIKVAANSTQYLYLPGAAECVEEIRVIGDGKPYVIGLEPCYLIQSRSPGKLWVTHKESLCLNSAIQEALNLHKNPSIKESIMHQNLQCQY
jgi:hypothetical protein